MSYLVSEQAIATLPLNGRNYTDLTLLQPGVIAYPSRDGGSVVAHGLGMSVNGQDYRSNVYLLDGTLLNDFTNGPAGSAAGTTLGIEPIQEFRVEANAYPAEFGRNFGGQMNVITKSGTNTLRGSAYEFHRNDALDAANYFDVAGKPDFTRNQFGGAVGGPLMRDRLFYFVGYEALRENLGKTISSFVPDDNARLGTLPDGPVTIASAVRPYLDAIPRANGPSIGSGLATHTFNFDQTLDQDFFLQGPRPPARHRASVLRPVHLRRRASMAADRLPAVSARVHLDEPVRDLRVPQRVLVADAADGAVRLQPDADRPERRSEPDAGAAAVCQRPRVWSGTSTSAACSGSVRRAPPTFGWRRTCSAASTSDSYARGAPDQGRFRRGALPRLHDQPDLQPRHLCVLERAGVSAEPAAAVRGTGPDRRHQPRLAVDLLSAYVQDQMQLTPTLSINGGLRYEGTTMPIDQGGRDSALVNLTDPAPTVGVLYQNPSTFNLSPRVGAAWDVFGDGLTSVRGGYGLYYNTNNQQNLIVTVTNPPATPRFVIANPTFPNPPFERGVGNTIRPVEWELKAPRLHMWNVNVQRSLPASLIATVGYAGSRGKHLFRNTDINIPTPTTTADGRYFFAAGLPRPNRSFGTIELKSSDGDSWYKALVFELRRTWRQGFSLQSSYTWSSIEDTTQASTFFSDATNGTTVAFPNSTRLQPGPCRLGCAPQLGAERRLGHSVARGKTGIVGALLDDWQVSGISPCAAASR